LPGSWVNSVLSVKRGKITTAGTEGTEMAQRNLKFQNLCALSVSSVPAVVSFNSLLAQE